MYAISSYCFQKGTALIFSLLILLIMTIIGVAVMSNTQMQERMSGNVALQSQAFEAASAGISDALRFGMNEFFGDPDASPTPSDLGDARCTRDRISEWRTGTSSKPRYGVDTDLPLMKDSVQTVSVQYQLRAECFQDPGLAPANAPAEGYVTSLGAVYVDGIADPLATREVEVRVDDFRTDGLSALRIEGAAEIDFKAANSNNFFISGEGGPAVTATTDDNAGDIVTAIESAGDGTRLANYDGGVSASDYDPPFNSAWMLARFGLEIKAFLEFHELVGSDIPTTQADSDQCVDADLPAGFDLPIMGLIQPAGSKFSVTGNKSFEGITYIDGDLDMRGGAEGNGLVIVEGDVTWAGTDEFRGLVITLGGDLQLGGGGQAETIGMLYVANLDLDQLSALYDLVDVEGIKTANPGATWTDILNVLDGLGNPDDVGIEGTEYSILDDGTGYEDDGFGDTSVTFLGGGGHTITYDCQSFDNQRQILKACGQLPSGSTDEDGDDKEDGSAKFKYDGLADPWKDQGCGIPGQGGSIQALRSWRENLGWRELLESAG